MTEEERAKIHAELAAVYDRIARSRTTLADADARLESLRARTVETNRRLLAHAADLEGRLANEQPTR